MVDLKKLYGVFIDEASEHIAEIENGLLDIEKNPQDKELINKIFRSAHTIKGSSGTLGLKDISRFTHNMEEILELMRQEKLAPKKEIINTLLKSTDIIKEMVEALASERDFDFSRCSELVKSMQGIIQNASEKGSEQTIEPHLAPKETGNKEGHYMITFIPDPDLFKKGIDPSVILDDLKNIGEITSIRAYTDKVPALSDLNPENLYMRWGIKLKTDKGEGDIRSIFEFVEDGSEIRILPVASLKNDIPPIGRMLVDEGVITPNDIQDALKTQKKLGEILVEHGKVNPKDIENALFKQDSKKAESVKNSISSTIRVDLKKLDHLINAVGEMIIVHSMIGEAFDKNGNGNGMAERFDILFSQLQRIGSDIQESAMSLRMLPVGDVFQRFTRLVRELSASKNKEIELIITGEETELDKGVLEKISDPLVHLIRNSIDHGIETTEQRISKGKPSKGIIHLSAYQRGDSVYIEVEDDGRGLSKEKIIEKAVSRGIIGSPAGLADDEIYNLIFLPGFSTADKVTDVSGRGVGMDVVKKNIESLKGRVFVRTIADRGAIITIKLPLTLAIIDGLTVLIGEEIFVIPISSVSESIRPSRDDVKTLSEKGEVINVRGEYIPLLRLHDMFNIKPWKRNPWEAIAIVTAHNSKKYCLLVDDLLGQQQIVLKNLGAAVPKVKDISGGTILGDGKVALVLDVPGIVETATRSAIN